MNSGKSITPLIANDGVTQKTMAKLAEVSLSAINRYITSNEIKHMQECSGRNYRYSVEQTIGIISGIVPPLPIYKKKHAFYNFKGGAGKTSVCFQIASHVALMGYSVLVIDADPQSHLSVSLGINEEKLLTLYDIMVLNRKPKDVIKSIHKGLDCIPSNLSLTRLEPELSQATKREERLSLDLAELEDEYDFIYIDTNPAISILNRNIINYVDVLEIVCETQPYSINGLKMLMEDLMHFYEKMRIPQKKINIIPNKYEDRTANSAEAMTALREFYSQYLKENFAVRRSEDIITSAKIGKPLAFFAKNNSNALEDIIELIHYIIGLSSTK